MTERTHAMHERDEPVDHAHHQPSDGAVDHHTNGARGSEHGAGEDHPGHGGHGPRGGHGDQPDHGGHAEHGGHSQHGGHADPGGHADHVAQFRRLFWSNLVLAVPVVMLSAMFATLMGYELPEHPAIRWIAPVLGTAMFLSGGRPFL